MAYADPPTSAPSLAECSFYHTIDLPGLGVQHGQWDLRPNIAHYLGDVDFRGKRVLEIGTANGFVCFEMERRGAEVTAFDLAQDLTYDAPPQASDHLQTPVYLDGLRRIRNAFWLAHGLLKSRARVAYGHANRLPEFLGRFDVGVMANVLQHLQDPIGALLQLASRCDEIVVTEADWMHGFCDDIKGMIYFDKDNPYVWCQVKPPLVEALLRRLGFGDFRRTEHRQLFVIDAEHTDAGARGVKQDVLVPHFTLCARRPAREGKTPDLPDGRDRAVA